MLLRRAVSAVVLVLALSVTVACGAPATVVTPQGKIAYTADQIATRIGELEQAAIQANTTKDANGKPGIPDTTAIPLVQFCISAEKTLKATPAGWQASVTTAWAEAKKAIPPADAQKLAVVIQSVDVVLAAVGGGL